jgi:hypothetical protein
VARACVQSITIDEADTYLAWVARPNPSHWEAASNNHVLNSLLMRLFTSVLGVSHLTVRAPALLGAAIYIASVYLLCVQLAPALTLQWPLFVCLVYNPFLFDHLVAARGYALALGFLTAALALAANRRPQTSTCAACSVCAALSFAANFSFAFVDAAAIAAIFFWACARTQAFQERVRILGACVLPGLLVSVFLSAPGVLHWPKGQLDYGAHSLGQTFRTVAQASLYRPNPQLVNPILLGWIERSSACLLPLLFALAAWQWVRRRNPAVHALLAIVAAALAAHCLALAFFHVLLPRDRTAIWLVPLLTLAIGAAATGRRALTVMLYVMSIYFLLCLRLTYFKEWGFDADVNRVYPVIAWYNHTYGVTDVASSWLYSASLNFYRLQSGRESLDEIPGSLQPAAGHSLYVLNWAFDEAFLKEQHLRVVYRAPDTDAVVAIRPQLEARAFSIN